MYYTLLWLPNLSTLGVSDEGYSRTLSVSDEGYSRTLSVSDEGYSRNASDLDIYFVPI